MTTHNPKQEPFHDVVPVLMAGGIGTRFWPLSTPARPKQFLTDLVGRSLYQQAAERARLLAPWDRILVMTNERFVHLVREQTAEAPPANVILEPCRRDTAAAIILAAVVVERRRPGSIMVVMPSDHLIADHDGFRETMARAAARARDGGLGTIGIRPTRAATGFGYLRLARPPLETEPVRVEQFIEKPDRTRAEQFVKTGEYLWNSGMFIWRAATLLEAAARHLPETYAPLAGLADAVGTDAFAARAREAFQAIQPVSIDYGIMEKAEDVWAIPAIFQWKDIGGWVAAGELIPADAAGNRTRGNVFLDQAADNLVLTDADHLMVVVGVKECILVHGPAGTLVCHKSAAGRIKALIERAFGGKQESS